MANDDELQGVKDFFSSTTDYNALQFIIRQTVAEMLSTAELVRIDSVSGGGSSAPAGTVSATPLVAQTDAKGNALPMASIPYMRFFRYQAGNAALIIDPVAGDQCLAVYCKRDSSAIQPGISEPQTPASFRSFDQADGVAFPAVNGKAPTVWIHIKQDNTITIHAPAGVTVESSGGPVTINAASIEATASNITMTGTVTVNGPLTATGNVSGDGIQLSSHTHSGVERGSSNTNVPNR